MSACALPRRMKKETVRQSGRSQSRADIAQGKGGRHNGGPRACEDHGRGGPWIERSCRLTVVVNEGRRRTLLESARRRVFSR